VYRSWSWPAQPAPGQQELHRTPVHARSPRQRGGEAVEDRGIDVVNPPGSVRGGRARSPWSAFLGSGQTGCGFGERDTRAGTWSRFNRAGAGWTDVSAGGFYDPSLLARGVAAERGGSWAGLSWTASRLSS